MDQRLQQHAGFGVARGLAGDADIAGLDEGPEQVDRRDADDRHGELDLEHAGIDVAQPFRLVGMALEPQARDEGLVAADDHHDQQVRDHHHVDQPEHDQHDLLLAEIEGMGDEVPEFLEEQEDIDALRHDEADIERQLQPARAEDDGRQRLHRAKRGGLGGRVARLRHGRFPILRINCRYALAALDGEEIQSAQALRRCFRA